MFYECSRLKHFTTFCPHNDDFQDAKLFKIRNAPNDLRKTFKHLRVKSNLHILRVSTCKLRAKFWFVSRYDQSFARHNVDENQTKSEVHGMTLNA